MGCSRLGTFFFLAGLVLLALFIGSMMNGSSNVIYLIFTIAAMFLAYLFRRRAFTDSGRFRAIRRARDRRRKRREEREQREQEERAFRNE